MNGGEEITGILFENPEEDIAEINRIFDIGISEWNQKWGAAEDVVLSVSENGVVVVSKWGGKAMFRCLPQPPDSFKRVAALLVMMALHPFIIIGRSGKETGMFKGVLQGDALRPFAIWFAIETLPLIFPLLHQEVIKDGQATWVQLKSWKGFPNQETLDEFTKLLYSLSKSNIFIFEKSLIKYDEPQLGQAILGVSLLLRTAYGEV